MFHLTVYILKNGLNLSEIIEVFDDETNASQMKENLIKTGQYRSIAIDSFEVDTDKVNPLEVVKVSGYISNGVVSLKVKAYSPTAPIEDMLIFTVSNSQITFTGFVNLDEVEQDAEDITELKARISAWVLEEFKARLEDNNPPTD